MAKSKFQLINKFQLNNIKLLLNILFLSIFLSIYAVNFIWQNSTDVKYKEKYILSSLLIRETEYKSPCHCHRNKIIVVRELEDISDLQVVLTWKKETYTVPKSYINYTTCDLYNTFKRGKNQKVVSYTLFGKKERYNKLIKSKKIF